MTRQIVLVHPSRLRGENHGVYIQHVATMQWLFEGDDEFAIDAVHPLHPRFADAASDADLVIVHALPHREIDALLRLRRARNLPTIFEFSDNFLDLGGWLPRNHIFRSPLVRQNLLYYAARSDAVQVYAPALAELFAQVNPQVITLDPYVPLAAERAMKSDERFVFGWGGTTSHEADLAPIAPAVVDFCRTHDDVTFAYMGDAAMFARHFAAIPQTQTRVTPFGPYDEYLGFVRGLDAGLAPVADSGFNAGRTDTKFATYAASGVAAIVQDAGIHRPHSTRALLFRDADELRGALERLHGDRELLRKLAREAYEWAREHRGAQTLKKQRRDAYAKLMQPAPALVPRPSYLVPDSALSTQDSGLGDAVERLIALDGSVADARALAAAFPDYVQAQWALVAALERSGALDDALAHLGRVEWPALYAAMAAEVRVRIARRTSPQTAAPLDDVQSPLARLRFTMSPARDGDAFHRAVLREQPYDYFSLSAVIRSLQRDDPQSHELDELYARACLLAPELVPHDRRPAALLRFLPR